ncbi:ACS family hexuronate transporter-like MFS transporter [Bacillus sp. SLBN-46]|uniref:MFS transporter n=1 Tax=Bacillus sp. SLBN-46 TaxID=3042283 RepID=UPI002862395C|nr:MFS transporter [Bacillus sp. SLBN-46]MDR6124510.1 ACS family hexuronate transporter-like MFS transporter [Bacillus sp. SLBN-46]
MKRWTKWVILLALFIMSIVNFADKSITGLAGIHIMKDLNLTFSQFGMVGSSFFWLFSLAGIVGASLSDRYGTGKILAVMAIIWTMAQSMVMFISGLPLLLFSRVLLGVGEGPFQATAISHISKWFKPESRGLAISIINFGNIVGIAVTAPIVVFLMSNYGWKQTFFISGILSFVWLISWLWLGRLKSDNSFEEEGNKQENKQETYGKDIWKALRSPIFIFTSLAACIGFSYIVFGLTFNPAYLMKVKGFTEQQAGKIIAISGLIGAMSSLVLAIISDRIYKKTLDLWKSRILFSASSLILAGILYALYPLVNGKGSIITILSLVYTVVVTAGNLNPTVIISLLPERRGVMTGTYYGIMTSSGIFAPIIFGKLIQTSGANPAVGFSSSIYGISVAMVSTALLMFLFGKPKKRVITENKNKIVNL